MLVWLLCSVCMCLWRCLYGGCWCLRLCMHVCECACLYGVCVVLVCVSCHVCILIVCVFACVCMFVRVCACVVFVLCLYVSLALYGGGWRLHGCMHVCECVCLYGGNVVFVCVSGHCCMVIVCLRVCMHVCEVVACMVIVLCLYVSLAMCVL